MLLGQARIHSYHRIDSFAVSCWIGKSGPRPPASGGTVESDLTRQRGSGALIRDPEHDAMLTPGWLMLERVRLRLNDLADSVRLREVDFPQNCPAWSTTMVSGCDSVYADSTKR